MVGTGWRAELYWRVARALPRHFSLCAVTTRRPERATEVADEWGVRAYPDLDSMLESARLDFVVVSVPWQATLALLHECARHRVAALCETPPAPDVDGLDAACALARDGARIEVAEQYPFQPLHAARLALQRSGAIGAPSSAYLSVAHGYHAIGLLRRHLDVPCVQPVVHAVRHEGAIEPRADLRAGERGGGGDVEVRTSALFDFHGRTGIYDFADVQYFSDIRAPHVVVRGSAGEIADDELRSATRSGEPTTVRLVREEGGADGRLEGHYLRGISTGDRWPYRNPFPGARLYDDEIAVATCMELMGRRAGGASSFYSVAQGAQDHYLYLALQEAARTGEAVRCTPQSWAGDLEGDDPSAVCVP
ncbi:MAG: Gfo/Idh/MocA family protein [Acidimicrobiales bacterium]